MAAARLGPKGPAKTVTGAAGGAGSAAGASKDGGPSDQSKMEMQLSLDVDEFVVQLEEQLSLPPAISDTLLSRLRAVVAPP